MKHGAVEAMVTMNPYQRSLFIQNIKIYYTTRLSSEAMECYNNNSNNNAFQHDDI